MFTKLYQSTELSDQEPMSRINVTPLVDVMLVLLIIFMITSPMLVAGISVDLPESQAKPVANQDEPLTITVDQKGKIYLQESRVTRKTLINKLQAISKERQNLRIFVRGDKRIDYGKIMDVVGTINAAGFTKVALITDIEN